MYELAVKNGNTYKDSIFQKLNLYIDGGIIAEISAADHDAKKTIDAGNKKIIPGIIDPHVHFELNTGKYTSADDFKSGPIAGAFGGVTTFIDFLDPVCRGTDVQAAYNKRTMLAKKSCSDFSFHLTAANPVNETEKLIEESIRLKIPSVKIFTAYSESGRRTFRKEIIDLLKLSRTRGPVILVHAEDEDRIDRGPGLGFTDLSLSRPVDSELNMIKQLAGLVEENRGRLYIVHTSCGESVAYMQQNHSGIINAGFFMESCPHYFLFSDTRFKGTDGYRFILAPPLRSENQVELLKENIDGLYSIGTDHCPFMSFEKNGKLLADIPFGIGGIEFSFPVMYSLFGERIIDKMTLNPAALFGLYPRKGVLSEGSDADFFIFDDSIESEIERNHSKCDYNLYRGFIAAGRVEKTIVRGKTIIDKDRAFPNEGLFIAREVPHACR